MQPLPLPLPPPPPLLLLLLLLLPLLDRQPVLTTTHAASRNRSAVLRPTDDDAARARTCCRCACHAAHYCYDS
jgi:hypothetical protein